MSDLTVYILTYNRAFFLKKCIDSVLEQSMEDFEIIILDNASTDNTMDIVNSFSDERIRYHRHKKNLGGIGNINYALNSAQSKYVVVFHDDDVMKKDYLETLYRFMEDNEECSMVSCLNDEIDENGTIISENITDDANLIMKSGEMLEKYIYNQYNLIFPTIMYRVESIKKYNIHLDAEVGPCADVIMYLNAEEQGACLGVINKALVSSRIHRNQDSSQNFGSMLIALIRYMMKKSYYAKYLTSNQKGQKRYYDWFAKNIVTKVASQSISYKMGKQNIYEMGELLRHSVIKKMLFNMILFSEKMFPEFYHRLYINKKTKKKRKKG